MVWIGQASIDQFFASQAARTGQTMRAGQRMRRCHRSAYTARGAQRWSLEDKEAECSQIENSSNGSQMDTRMRSETCMIASPIASSGTRY